METCARKGVDCGEIKLGKRVKPARENVAEFERVIAFPENCEISES